VSAAYHVSDANDSGDAGLPTHLPAKHRALKRIESIVRIDPDEVLIPPQGDPIAGDLAIRRERF
jgi:hypothetical protein